jgi:hypothetical protein
MLLESSLNGMQFAIGSETLDGCNIRAGRLHGKERTALDRFAIHVNHTGAALVGVTADMGTRQAKFFPDKMDEQSAILALAADRPAVHRQSHSRHIFLLASPPEATAII